MLFLIISTILFFDKPNVFLLIFNIFFILILIIWKEKTKILIYILFFIYIYLTLELKKHEIDNFEINDKIFIKNKLFKNNYIFEYDNKKILIFSKNIKENLIYSANLQIKKINSDEVMRDFLYSNNIYYKVVKINNFLYKNEHENFLITIKKFILNSKNNYLKFVPLLLLGKNHLENNELINILKKINIYHLFVISGFHIAFIKIFFEKIFNFLKIKYFIFIIFCTIFLLFYLLILDFSVSALRAFIFLILLEVNKKIFLKKYKNYEILIFTGFIFIIQNIYIVYSISFILSFFISLVIIFITNLKIKNKFMNLIVISTVANISSFLILNFFNVYNYNVLSVFNSIIFSPLISLLYSLFFLLFWAKDFIDYICGYLLKLLIFYEQFQIIYQIYLSKWLIFILSILFFWFLPLINLKKIK